MSELSDFDPNAKFVRLDAIYSSGIEDAEGTALYSVSMTVDVVNKKASNVVMTHLASKKKFLMSQVSFVKSLNIPVKCAAGDVNGLEGYSFKGAGTNMVIYYVPKAYNPRVVYFLPIGPQDWKL